MKNAIVWFRQDLRLYDNLALSTAITDGYSVIPIYIIDNSPNLENIAPGSASKLWLHHSLISLNKSLDNKLLIIVGDPLVVIQDLAVKYNVHNLYFNKCYEKQYLIQDLKIATELQRSKLKTHVFNSTLLWEPENILKNDNTSYKVFTPFYKNCLSSIPPRKPVERPKDMIITDLGIIYDNTTILNNYLPIKNSSWKTQVINNWIPGEQGANHKLHNFFTHKINLYKDRRDFPYECHSSQLSPHLHFGEISPHILWEKLHDFPDDENIEKFRSELVWREFSYNLMFYFPDMYYKNFQNKFDKFPWQNDPIQLQSWQQGNTGIPIIDAGMRELWQTGYMHNRVRMIVASFLVKNLMIDWRLGAAWFWDTLFDADLANNSNSWQWVAGCGVDAAPYFRIFNPILQSKKFDAQGLYIKQYIPELKDLPAPYIHEPASAPESFLKYYKIKLGVTYPYPIVDLSKSRINALNALKSIS